MICLQKLTQPRHLEAVKRYFMVYKLDKNIIKYETPRLLGAVKDTFMVYKSEKIAYKSGKIFDKKI